MNRPENIPEDIWNDAQRVFLFGVSPVAIAGAILAERQAMRERCANIAEQSGSRPAAIGIAAAIRALE
jgi:hypothetical protein